MEDCSVEHLVPGNGAVVEGSFKLFCSNLGCFALGQYSEAPTEYCA